MSTSILCVGTELLLGQIDDTNSGFIARELLDNGIDSFEQRTIGDNFDRIKNTIISMLDNCDSIIIAGGLGPTHDDITRDVVASVMNVDLEINKDAEENMRQIFEQAMVPVGAEMIANT